MTEATLDGSSISYVKRYLREKRYEGVLSEEQIRRLDAIGFKWEKQKHSARKSPAEMVELYIKIQGHKVSIDTKGKSYLIRRIRRDIANGLLDEQLIALLAFHKFKFHGRNEEMSQEEHLRLYWDITKNNTEDMGHLSPTKSYWWKCPDCGYEWNKPLNKELDSKGCPACLGRACIPGWTDLATTYPELADEWNYERNGMLKPIDVVAGSAKRVWWKCHVCGGEWQAPVVKRKSGKGNCPFCAGKKLMKGVNDLASQYPQVALDYLPELNGGVPADEVIVKYGTKIRWHCHVCGYEWVNDVYNRTRAPKPSGCRHCHNLERARAEREKKIQMTSSFKESNPGLAALWDLEKNNGQKPEELLPTTNGRFWFTCPKCGKSFKSCLRRKTLICDECARVQIRSGRTVRCVETGETYVSIRAAGKAIGRDSSCISKALSHQQRTAGGYHWEYVDTTEKKIEEAN